MTAGTKGTWSDGGETDGELLVATADRLRWRAPELALVFARRAAMCADAAQDKALALRANALVVATLVRLGKHAEAVEPAVLTLREAESSGARELAGSVRVDLAASTRAIGLAGSAFVLVRPMLEGCDIRPSVRAGALAEIVAGLAQAGRREVIDEVLSEADRLYAADDKLGSDVRRVLRALLCARIASLRRRWGNPTGAVAAATEGMTLLDGLAEPSTDSGQARAELGLEMVSALLDAGETAAALGQADQTLTHPVRATSAAAIGRLMLVLATRVHLPSGRHREAHALFAEIVRVSRRHEFDGLLADVLTSLAHAQEADGDLTGALDALRSARAAEQRRLRADTMARLIVLEELGAGTRLPDDTEALLRRVVRTPARSLPDTSRWEYSSREATSREMSGLELGGEDIGTQDLPAREPTGWEMAARERAAMEAGPSRALSDLVDADRAAPQWPTVEGTAPDLGWPSEERFRSSRSSRSSSDWVDSEFTGSGSGLMAAEHVAPGHSASDQAGSKTTGSGIAAASSGGGRRRAPVEWSAADRVAADRIVSEPASADAEDHVAAVDGSQPKWPDPDVAEERDEETGLLNRQGLRRRLAAARRHARPTALTLVRLEPAEPDPQPEPCNPDPDSTDRLNAALIKAIDRSGRVPEFGPAVLSSLADHVRDMAPDDAELVRPEEGELAVLMPGTTRDEAEQFAANLRETVSASAWDLEDPARGVSVSTGVAQYQEGTSEDALLTAAREDLTSTEPDTHTDRQYAEPVYDLPPEDSGHAYVQQHAQLSPDGPEPDDPEPDGPEPDDLEPDDPEMAEYLAGFSLPRYGRRAHTEERQWSHSEEPDMPPRHDTPTADKAKDDGPDNSTGRSVLDRLEITRGSGGRRRAPDSFAAGQSADYAQYPSGDSPSSLDKSPDSPDSSDDAKAPAADFPYRSDTSTYTSDRSPNHAQAPPPDRPYSPYPQYPAPGRSPACGSTGDEILAAAEEADARVVFPPAEPSYPEPQQEEAAHPATPGDSPHSPARREGRSRNSARNGEESPGSALNGDSPHGSALPGDDPPGSARCGGTPRGSAHGQDPQGSAAGRESPQSPATERSQAPRASIPHVPDPEEVPVPPDEPGIPAVGDPENDLQPRRRGLAANSDIERPGRRRMPEQAQNTDIPPPGGPGAAQAGRRRRIADYLESAERVDPEAAAPGRRRCAEQGDPVVPADEPEAGCRRAAENRPSPLPRPKIEAKPEPRSRPAAEAEPEPAPKPEPQAPKDPQEPRRRLTSILDGQQRPGLPPEPSEPRDPPIAAENVNPGKPSRNRRRDKTGVKLADLLAEALVAYQASTSDNPDEDVLSAYDDAAGRVADDSPRRERETGY